MTTILTGFGLLVLAPLAWAIAPWIIYKVLN
jgi:hypothetical protein